MKKTLLLVWMLLFSFGGFAQSNPFYYYKGKKKSLNLDKSKVNIFTTNDFDRNSVVNLTSKDFVLNEQNVTHEKWATIDFGSQLSDVEFYQKLNSLKNNSKVVGIGYHYKANKGRTVGTSNIFYIQLKNENDLPLLQREAELKKAIIIEKVDSNSLWYCLRTTKTTVESSVELANYFMETGKFAEIDPAFMLEYTFDDTIGNVTNTTSTNTNCVTDTAFGLQWGLNNSTHPEFDINACQAWSVPNANGNGVKVAVIDTGIKLDHLDITNNILPNSSFCTEDNHQPSQLTTHFTPQNIATIYKENHGMHVAGIIGAVGNNARETSGVAPNCKIIGISNELRNGTVNSSVILARGFNWAMENEIQADIINCSWFCNYYNEDGEPFNTSILESKILFTLNNGRGGKGCIITFITGNEYGPIIYPAYIDPRIMVVGAINSSGSRAPFSCYYTDAVGFEANNIDVVAPGVDIYSLIINTIPVSAGGGSDLAADIPTGDGVDQHFHNGTSMAAPHVSGLAALLLSVNPCLTGQQVRDIIEQTAQKLPNYVYATTAGRPNGSWNNETGYGLIDAYAAVQMAQQMYSSSIDLMVKDSPTDTGTEPNTTTQYMWTSDDIWVRNSDNGMTNQIHENPEYTPSVPNYVYVRVTNKSCAASTGNEQLKLYWAKASTGLGWPNPWNGGIHENGGTNALMGEPLGIQPIPSLQPGQETIIKFPWEVPNPSNYSQEQWHFCLLTKIESNDDPLTFAETSDLNANVRNNNNIAWKNISVYDAVPDGGPIANNTTNEITVAVANPFNQHHSFFLEIVKEDLETGKDIYDEAEVSIKMNDVLYNAWERGGKEAQMVEATLDQKKKIVKGNHVIIDNILFNPNESGRLTLKFNFLTKELTDKAKFVYHVIQKDAQTGNTIGGETYVIRKKDRPIFIADAGGDKDVDKNEPITISASQISEPAIYNWYDTDGNLIFSGKDLAISTDIAKKYKLEVIATADGFKDYAEVEVKLKPSTLASITPNPVSNLATISYKLNEVSSAYLMILGYSGSTGTSNNYLLDVNSSQTTLDFSSYPIGFYTVALVCNGQIVDAKTMIKE